ncbi:Lytic transglycosylase catalytic [Parvibaculum lavamentivorans DS-1]|uniref:Lytic transglycosylase catalytic n=2 Tax=Parvibaculum lavamentivorans TaxID=256618 RepID=A7HRR5_PARL1|nr:Lytic transglycosylase catalytic [Parvibaculum lavamentivorans DS-1]
MRKNIDGTMAWLRRAGAALRARMRLPATRSRIPWIVPLLLVLFGANHFIYLYVYRPPVPQGIEAIRDSGKLVVLTRLAPTTWYEGADGLTGFEYEMMQRLGKSLGVEVEYRIYDTEQGLMEALAARKGHLAAAGLAVTEARKAAFAIGPEYETVRQLLACRRDVALPKKPSGIKDLRLVASRGTPAAEALAIAVGKIETVSVTELNQSTEELLARAAAGDFDCVAADSLIFKVNNPYHPELVQAFDLTGEMPVAWFLAPGSEDLKDHLRAWFAGAKKSGAVAALQRRFSGFLPLFDYVDLRAFNRAVEERLPDYEKLIRRAARENKLSWQLLAAIAYQESHWNPDAISPTGVRGFMMLTRQTAEHLGVENRLDPAESIAAGTRYLADIKRKLPPSVQEPDRTWFALAAWNLGLGHVYDARALATRLGRDRDNWADLRRVLPLLNNAAYTDGLKHGRARGGQAVHFVQQVRTYMHILEAGSGS